MFEFQEYFLILWKFDTYETDFHYCYQSHSDNLMTIRKIRWFKFQYAEKIWASVYGNMIFVHEISPGIRQLTFCFDPEWSTDQGE